MDKPIDWKRVRNAQARDRLIKDFLDDLPEAEAPEDITAVETPKKLRHASKRSGEYKRAEFAQALEDIK